MTLHEIATIWSDGTRYTAADLVRAYRSYAAKCEEKGIDPDDAETFFERDMEIPNVEASDWYWIDGTPYCPSCVECESPAIDQEDATRGPCESGRCACCGTVAGEEEEAE